MEHSRDTGPDLADSLIDLVLFVVDRQQVCAVSSESRVDVLARGSAATST
jgi:hypothetical protein